MLVADKFLIDIMERIKRFEAETGIEVRLIKIDRVGCRSPVDSREKTCIAGISMEAS